MTAAQRLAASVLAAEALVLGFFVLTAIRLFPDDAATMAAIGVMIAAASVVLIGCLRFPWAFWAGWALQVVLIATGLIVPTMFLIGAIFAVLWYVALRLGRKVP